MADTHITRRITQLPLADAVDGSELFETVQSGASKRVSLVNLLKQPYALVTANPLLTQGRVLDVENGVLTLSDGGAGNSLTFGLANGGVTNAKLATMAQATVKGRAAGSGSGAPVDLTAAQLADVVEGDLEITESQITDLKNYADLDESSEQTFAGDIVVQGDLTVQGSVTYIDTQTLNIGDNIITLNADEEGSPSQNAGLEVERGTSDNVFLRWNEAVDQWELTNDGSTFESILTSADTSFPDDPDVDAFLYWNDYDGQAEWVDAAFLTAQLNVFTAALQGAVPASGGGTGTVLRADATWGQLTAAMIPNDIISNAMLRNSAAVSVIGRSANSVGDPADITAGANDRLLRRTGDTLNFGQLTSGMFPNDVVPDGALSSNVPLLDQSNTFSADQRISKTNVKFWLTDTSSAADEGKWVFDTDAAGFNLYAVDDAEAVFASVFNVLRTGTTVDSVTFPEGAVSITDSLAIGGGQTISDSDNVALLDVSNTWTAEQVIDISVTQWVFNHDSDAGNQRDLIQINKDTSRMWELEHDYNNEDLVINRFNASGVFQIAAPATASSLAIGGGQTISDSDNIPLLDAANVFTSLGGSTTPTMELANSLTNLRFHQTDAAADEGIVEFINNVGRFRARLLSDDFGTSEYWLEVDRTGTTVDTVNFPNGELQYGGVEVETVSSSTRYKENITPSTIGLKELLQLETVEFDWRESHYKSERDGRRVGLIAEQVDSVIPYVTEHSQDGQIQRFASAGMIGVLVNATKELHSRLETLEQHQR